MSIHDEASLILKLYELRREETMRKARDWWVRDFHPESLADITNAMFSDKSGYLRMVMTYWDMAAALVNRGAIGLDLFNETNSELFAVFCKMEPFLGELRTAVAPTMLLNMEKLVDNTPGGRERSAQTRERMKMIRSELMSRQAKAAGKS